MALHIEDPETDRLARELAATTGESLTQAIRTAVRERHARYVLGEMPGQLVDFMDVLSEQSAARLVLDDRSPEVILGYDEHGLPS